MISATQLFSELLLNQTKQDVPGFERLTTRIDFTEQWLKDFDRDTHTRLAGRLNHVRGLYKPYRVRDSHFIFQSGCLEEYKDGHLKFRRRSEWFPKLISDLLFMKDLTRFEVMTVTVPQLFMKPEAAPVIRMWAHKHGYRVSDWIEEQAEKHIAKYPDPYSCLANKRRAVRAWLLRYLVLTGQLEADRFQAFRRV